MTRYSPGVQKPRTKKTPVQLWVADNRKRLGETPADIARLTGVTTDTARAWESRGSPNEDALRVLERHFGVPVPTEASGSGPHSPEVSALISSISELVAEIRAARRERSDLEERVLALELAAKLQAGSRDGEDGEPAAPRQTVG